MSNDALRKVRSHRDLIVWQKAMDLVDMIYKASARFPAFEGFGLRSQITRSAVSIPANIAEGQARATSKDFANFLTIAWSSLVETDTLLEVAVRQGYLKPSELQSTLSLMEEVGKMLLSLRKSIRNRATR
jgi:four helix bundle protein